jgi:hypothetical protein
VNISLERRRELLSSMLSAAQNPLRLSPLLQAPSTQVLEAVRKLGLEGVIGKRIGSIYEPGERSGAWIKHRTDREQEFLIGGYIPGAHGFDAFVGVYENKEFIFVAKVKDGFVPQIRGRNFSSSQKAERCLIMLAVTAAAFLLGRLGGHQSAVCLSSTGSDSLKTDWQRHVLACSG